MSEGVAQLYGGLAQGLFGRMREHDEEQRRQDAEQKQTTLKYLTGLIPDATPETRPVLLKQIADVVGLKGKHRGVWDMLTGQGREDYHQQLAGQLDSLMGRVVGPQKYEELRQQGVQQDMGAAFRANSPYVRSTDPKPTEGIVALRDPDELALEKIRTQYALRHEAEMNKLYEQQAGNYAFRSQLQQEKGALSQDRVRLEAEMKARGEIMRRAYAKAVARGGGAPNDEDWQTAGIETAAASGDKDAAERALVNLRGAQTGLAQAQAAALGTPGTPGYGMKAGEQMRFDQSQQQAGTSIYGKWNDARARAISLGQQLQTVHDQLKAQAESEGLAYDASRGLFLDPKTGKPETMLRKSTQDALAKAAALTQQKAQAEQEMTGHHKTLTTQYGEYFKGGEGAGAWWVEPNQGFGGVAPAGAPRTTEAPPPFPGQAGQGGQSDYQYQSSKLQPKGTIIPIRGERYRITGIARQEGGRYIYNLEKVQ